MWARHNFDKYVRVLLKQWPIFGSLITWDVNERSIRLNEIYHAVIYKVKCYRMLALFVCRTSCTLSKASTILQNVMFELVSANCTVKLLTHFWDVFPWI